MLKARITSRGPLMLHPGPLVLLVVGGDDTHVTVSVAEPGRPAEHREHRIGDEIVVGGRRFRITGRMYDTRDGDCVDVDEIPTIVPGGPTTRRRP